MKILNIRKRSKDSDVNSHSTLLFIIGLVLLVVGLSAIGFSQNAANGIIEKKHTYDPTSIKVSVCQVLLLLEGDFGALIMVVAGLVAIISAAVGAYGAMIALTVVALGAFIMRSLVSLFFPYYDCATWIQQNDDNSYTITVKPGGFESEPIDNDQLLDDSMSERMREIDRETGGGTIGEPEIFPTYTPEEEDEIDDLLENGSMEEIMGN